MRISKKIQRYIAQSEDWNGHARERAVRYMGRLAEPEAIGALLIRANDWVPEVRSAAREALMQLMIPENAVQWVNLMPKLYHLKKCSRDDHAALLASTERMFLHAECHPSLEEGLHSDDMLVRRYCFLFLARHGLKYRESLMILSFSSGDVVLKRFVEEQIAGDKEISEDLLERALNDWYMPLRRAAMERYIRSFPDRADEVILGRLLDRSHALREAAQLRFRERGGDPVEAYIRWIKNDGTPSSQLQYSLLGLGCVGGPEHVDLVRTYWSFPVPRVRRATLVAIGKLDPIRGREFVLEALVDDVPIVLKTASRMISRSRNRPTIEEVQLLIELASHEQSLLIILGVTERLHRWDRLYVLLLVLRGARQWSDDLHARIIRELGRQHWSFRKGWIEVNDEKRERIGSQMDVARAMLSADMVELIEHHVFDGPETPAVLYARSHYRPRAISREDSYESTDSPPEEKQTRLRTTIEVKEEIPPSLWRRILDAFRR